jgi:hypothetical protein
MIKRRLPLSPYTARSRKDERIGYILRHWPKLHPGAIMTDYERVHHVLRLAEQYNKECSEGGPYYA